MKNVKSYLNFFTLCAVLASVTALSSCVPIAVTPLEHKESGLSESILSLSLKDDFSRSLSPVQSVKVDKTRYTGLFYFTWLGQHPSEMTASFDNTKFLTDQYGQHANEYLMNGDKTELDYGKYHFWGKPLYGYYDSGDPWVIDKHIELFTAAGIDFLAFDCTNGWVYLNVIGKILDSLQKYYDQGWNVPKIVFYTNTKSAKLVDYLYQGGSANYVNDSYNTPERLKNGIYKPGLYRDLWFCPNGDGKPMIVGVDDTTCTRDYDVGGVSGLITDQEIKNFFYLRSSQWPNADKFSSNGFPWIDWNRPQRRTATNGQVMDVIDVSVAQHNVMPFSKSHYDETTRNTIWGRGWHNGTYDHNTTSIRQALNFEEEFSYARSYDPKFTFITGWNEWVALKLGGGDQPPFFVDTFNEEFSRDAEMMDGGYLDNFYLTMVRNIKAIKYSSLSSKIYKDYNTINIKTRDYKVWNELNQTYYDFTGETFARNYKSFACTDSATLSDRSRYDASKVYTFEGKTTYTDNSNRNDIRQIKVASDQDNIYILVECKDDITEYEANDTTWMNVLLNVNNASGSLSNSFNYVINRNPSNGVTSVEKYQGSAYTSVGEASYSVDKNIIKFAIPRSALGATNANFTLNFKVCDHISDYTTAKEFYIKGDTAPAGRMSYTYYGK